MSDPIGFPFALGFVSTDRNFPLDEVFDTCDLLRSLGTPLSRLRDLGFFPCQDSSSSETDCSLIKACLRQWLRWNHLGLLKAVSI